MRSNCISNTEESENNHNNINNIHICEQGVFSLPSSKDTVFDQLKRLKDQYKAKKGTSRNSNGESWSGTNLATDKSNNNSSENLSNSLSIDVKKPPTKDINSSTLIEEPNANVKSDKRMSQDSMNNSSQDKSEENEQEYSEDSREVPIPVKKRKQLTSLFTLGQGQHKSSVDMNKSYSSGILSKSIDKLSNSCRKSPKIPSSISVDRMSDRKDKLNQSLRSAYSNGSDKQLTSPKSELFMLSENKNILNIKKDAKSEKRVDKYDLSSDNK